MAAFGSELLAFLGAVFLIGAAANAGSVVYIARTFPTREVAIFYVAQVDSIVSLTGNVLLFFTIIISNYTADGIFCGFQYAVLLLTVQSGLLMTAEIAVIRWCSVNLAKRRKKLDEKISSGIALFVLLLQTGLIMTAIANRALAGRPLAMSVELCMGKKGDSHKKSHLDAARIAIILWITLTPIVSLVSDALILLDMKRVGPLNNKPGKNKKVDYTIPVNATVIAAVFVVLTPMVPMAAFYFDLEKSTSISIGMVIVSTAIAFRCPLVTSLTFSAKVRADLKSKGQRQEREREWARQEREERRRNRAENGNQEFGEEQETAA